MKRLVASLTAAAAIFVSIGAVDLAQATPSTTFWTPATTDVQSYKVVHIGIDNYFTLGRKNDRGSLPTDIGLTVGVLPYEKIQMEVGMDWQEATTDPLSFNAKLGTPEGALFNDSPALNVGIFNVGTDRKVQVDEIGLLRTDYNIVHLMVGKTLPSNLGRFFAGVYHGNGKTLVNRDGKAKNNGYMVAWDKGLKPTKDKDGNDYNKWVMAADWASGKNAIGGGGVGIYHYFTKDIALLTGPVWLNDPAVASPNANAKWVWTTQLDINY